MNKVDVEIPKIKFNQGTYKNVEIEPNLINYFYGNNGTGKSTAAKEIFDLKNEHPECEFLIYNTEYKDDNLKELKGIFTLSEKNIEIEGQIEIKNVEINGLTNTISDDLKQKEAYEKSNTDLLDALYDGCKTISKPLQARCPEAFVGAKQINALLAKLNEVNPMDYLLDDIYKMYDTAFASDDKTYEKLTPTNTKLHSLELEGYKLLEKAIVSTKDTEFSNFLKRLNAFDWVNEGHKKFEKISEGKCPYCQSPLPKNFNEIIEQCFDETYTKNISDLNDFIDKYSVEWYPIINNLRRNLQKQIPEEFKAEYKEKLDAIEKILSSNMSAVSLKKKEPSTETKIDDLEKPLIEINDLINKVNASIDNYEDIIAHRKEAKKECTQKLLEYIKFHSREYFDEYDNETKANNGALADIEKNINRNTTRIEVLKHEIDELNKQTINTSDVVEKINNLLTLSGYQGFSLKEAPSEDEISRYNIIRADGTIAEHLSEGERNFIAFLYFYYQVKFSKSVTANNKKIVIIDDPVSSMDTNSLYIIASLVKEMASICANNYDLTGDLKYGDSVYQLFIFTHNIYFHNEITINQDKKPDYVSFFMITKEHNQSDIKECITTNKNGEETIYNPVSNSYTLLWQEYKEANSPMTKLNLIKRILDYYFIQFSGYKENDLLKLIDEKDDAFVLKDGNGTVIDSSKLNIAHALINQVSSYGRFQEDIYFSSITNETMPMFEHVFELIFTTLGQKQHFDMMMGKE